MSKKVLFLDDEQSVLHAIERSFSSSDFECFFAETAKDAYALLNVHQFGVVVSDMRMPEVDGVEFVVKAKEQQPLAVTMILSGFSDTEAVMNAVNKGHVWRYISKDLNKNDLILNVKNAWEYHVERMERSKLITELSKKNIELAAMNTQLEEKVADRTWELNERSEILSMMLYGEPVDTIMHRITGLIVKTFHIEKVFIHVPFLEKTYGVLNKKMDSDIQELSQKAFESRSIQVVNNITAIPLERSGKKLGVLIVDNSEHIPVDDIQDKFGRISTLINLALYQHKVVADAPETIKNIEQLLGEL